jgi:hypothetical protein
VLQGGAAGAWLLPVVQVLRYGSLVWIDVLNVS